MLEVGGHDGLRKVDEPVDVLSLSWIAADDLMLCRVTRFCRVRLANDCQATFGPRKSKSMRYRSTKIRYTYVR